MEEDSSADRRGGSKLNCFSISFLRRRRRDVKLKITPPIRIASVDRKSAPCWNMKEDSTKSSIQFDDGSIQFDDAAADSFQFYDSIQSDGIIQFDDSFQFDDSIQSDGIIQFDDAPDSLTEISSLSSDVSADTIDLSPPALNEEVKSYWTLVENINKERTDWTDARCEPVIDILHAQVFTKDTNIQVFGYIKIHDIQTSEIFPVYDRQQFECPQRLYSSLPLGNFLHLLGPEDIPSLIQPRVLVNIQNADTGDVVANGEQPLLNSTHHPSTSSDDTFEKLFTLQFQGNDANARVDLHCVAFTFGVYAQVEVFLYNDNNAPQTITIDEEDDDEVENGVEVFGLIYAQCNPLFLPKHNYVNHLFNVVKQEHEWVGLGGTEISLSKSLVAVPAYSQLEIKVDLKGFEDDFIVQGAVSFQPSNYNGGHKEVRGLNGYYVRVAVTWKEPSLLNKYWEDMDIMPAFCEMPQARGWYALNLLEIFSLFIARPNGKEMNLYGSVSVFCRDGWCNIFRRSVEEAYFLPQGCNLLPMQGPNRAVQLGMSCVVAVDLRDVDGHVKINGTALSSFGMDDRRSPWFDRRLCSVVRGENEKSFVAIHYTLFSFAIQALVTVCLVCKRRSTRRVKIYGDIFAYHDKFSYPTSYDKRFFRRLLFSRTKSNFLKVKENLELSSNLVVVPMTSSLLAEVNLSFQTVKGTHSVENVIKFEIGESRKVVASDIFDIHIDVEWQGLPNKNN